MQARDDQLLVILVAAVPGKDDFEAEIGVIPLDYGIQCRYVHLNVGENACRIPVFGHIGLIGAFSSSADGIAKIFNVVIPLAHHRGVIGVRGGPFERLFELRGHRRGIRGDRDSDLLAGQKTVVGDRRGGADRFDERRRGRAAGVGLRGDGQFRNFAGERIPQVGDIKLGLGKGSDFNLRKIGAEGTQGGLDVPGVCRRGLSGVDLECALVSVQAESDRAGNVGRRGNVVFAGIGIILSGIRIFRCRCVERQALNRRRTVEKLERGTLADLRCFDGDGDDLCFVGQVARVDVQVFADTLACDRVSQFIGRRPRRDHVVRGVHIGGHLAADVLPLGIHQHIVDRTDRQTQEMPFFQGIERQMTFFHLQLGDFLFARGKILFQNRFASFYRHVPKLVDTCQRHSTVSSGCSSVDGIALRGSEIAPARRRVSPFCLTGTVGDLGREYPHPEIERLLRQFIG